MTMCTCALSSLASTWPIIHLATVGFICILATGTAGEDVSASESLHTPRPLQTSASETQFTASALTSATSVAPLDIMIDTLSFNNPGDFVELYGFTDGDSTSPSSSKVGWSFEFYVKTDSQAGILLYSTPMSAVMQDSALENNENKRLESEYIAIEIINGKPALSIDDGEGILNVHSDIRISDGLWHHINAVFSPSHLELTVDRNSRTVKKANPALSDRISSSMHSHLNLTSIYLGGVDSIIEPVIIQQQIHTIYSISLEESSLVGCIREVKINRRVLEEKQIKNTSRFTRGPSCSWQFICELENPCIEDAQCYQSGFDSFICSCAEAECTRSDYVRASSLSSSTAGGTGATSVSKSRSKEIGHSSTSQVDVNEPVRGNRPYVHSTFPGAAAAGGGKSNLPGSSPRRKDDTTQDATAVGGKSVLQVSDLAAGQSHVDAHRLFSTGTSNAWGSGQRANLQPGHSSSFPSPSVAPSSASSSSSSSASAPSASSSSFSESPGNGNSLLPHLTPTSHNTLDSMHINHLNSVGGFASDAFNLVISKEQFLIVTVIVALGIVILLFSLVIRAFYLLGRKSKSRPSLKTDAPRNSSSASSSCSSPAQLMKENDNSCILPLTSTTTGSTSVAGSSSGGTSSSPLPFGSDCGFDHLTHLDSAINHGNFNSANQASLSLSMACAASANGLSSSGYGQIQHQHQQQQQQQHQASHVNSHCQPQPLPHLTGSHYSGLPGEQSDEMMHGHNLAMMMSRCSSSGSMASSPLPPPPDPVSTRSHLLTYAPGGSIFYKKQSDHIQLHAYPQSHQTQSCLLQQQHRQQRDCDTLPSSHHTTTLMSHMQQVDSSESSHLLMPATSAGMNKHITSPLSVTTSETISTTTNTNNTVSNECFTDEDDTCTSSTGVTGSTSDGNVTGNTLNMNSYEKSENRCSDHLSPLTVNSLTDAQVSLNYPESHEKRQLARYSTYGTVSSNKSPTGGIHSTNYTTDDIMDAYATYSRVDKKRNKNSCNTNESQKLPNHLQTTSPHHQQHRLSISSPSPSSASSSSPYTPTTAGSLGETIAINTGNRRDSTFIYPLPPPSLFFSRQQRPSNSNNPSSPLLNSHDLTTTFKW